MNGLLVLAMVTMAEVVAITFAEIVQAYSASKYAMPHPARSGAWSRKERPPSSHRPADRATLPLFSAGRMHIQEEGYR